MTHAERANRYAEQVVCGAVAACEWVRLACQRHLDDLKQSADPRYPYEFDHAAANKICRYVELLPHVKGKWLGTTIVLEDWQCFVYAVPFGWLRRADGLRRFRRVYLEIPRKNAKSTMSAGAGQFMFTADGEPGSEVYSGATTEKQAWEVFAPARLMAKNTEELRDHYGVKVGAKNMSREAVNAKFEPIIGNPGDGASPHMAIVDEYHEHATDAQYDTMMTGMGAREQPMMWTITTAGDDTAGPCYQLRGELINVLRGLVEDPEFCGAIWSIDTDDDWTSEDALRKANPNMGVSVFEDYLLSQQRQAIDNPRKQSTFKTKHLNVWVGASDPFFNIEKWNRRGDAPPIEEFAGEACWVGVDVAAKIDLAVMGKLFRRVDHWYWYPTFYLPEEQIALNRSYQGWVAHGYITATHGNVINLDEIEDNIKADAEKFSMVGLGFDPWNAQQLVTHLIDYGISCVEVHQTTPNLSDPMKWVQALIEDGRLHHDGNPVMSWCIDNVTAKPDRNENVFPRKEHAHKKIDGAVALIIAKGQALVDDEPSSYLDGGEIVVA